MGRRHALAAAFGVVMAITLVNACGAQSGGESTATVPHQASPDESTDAVVGLGQGAVSTRVDGADGPIPEDAEDGPPSTSGLSQRHLEYHLRFRSGFDFLSTDVIHIAEVVADGGHPEALRTLGLELTEAEWAEMQRRMTVLSRAIEVKRLISGRAFDEAEEALEGGGDRLPTGALFGGVWQDHLDGGRLKVAVTDASAVDLEALYGLFERGAADVVVIEQAYSLDDLRAWRGEIERRVQAGRVNAALGFDYSDIGVRIRVVLYPPSHDATLDSLLAGIPRDQVVIEHLTEEATFLPGGASPGQ